MAYDHAAGTPHDVYSDETEFWILVDVGRNPEIRPDYFIVPAWWMENSIHVEHQNYLARHGGQRAQNPGSTHHAVPVNRVEQWRERWDLLGIF
jgi:hypothetical protein